MSPRNRIRLKQPANFQERANLFIKTWTNALVSKKPLEGIVRVKETPYGKLFAGKKPFRGLAQTTTESVAKVESLSKSIRSAIFSSKVKPTHFELVETKTLLSAKTGVIQHFDRPTVKSLIEYLQATKSKRKIPFEANPNASRLDEYLVSKKFAKNPKNSSINMDKLNSAWKEFFAFCSTHASASIPAMESVIVLGANHEGKIKFAIVSDKKYKRI
jgi:hypothetical protein